MTTTTTQFKSKDGLSPMMTGILVDGMFSMNDFWAGFLELYIDDVISIDETKDKGAVYDYRAVLQKDLKEVDDPIKRELIYVFFGETNVQKGAQMSIWGRYQDLSPSDTKSRARMALMFSNLQKTIESKMIELGFWKVDPYPHFKWSMALKRSLKFLMYVYICSIPLGIYWASVGNFGAYIIIFGVVLLCAIFPLVLMVNFALHPFIASIKTAKARGASRTEKGEEAQKHLLGFCEYVRVAEKDRILFHYQKWEDVRKNPEEFLYAVALGVVKPYYLFLSPGNDVAREFLRTGRVTSRMAVKKIVTILAMFAFLFLLAFLFSIF